MSNIFHNLYHYTADSKTTIDFAVAGMLGVPISLTSEILGVVYYAILIPPAAYHCYLTVIKPFLTFMKDKIKNGK